VTQAPAAADASAIAQTVSLSKSQAASLAGPSTASAGPAAESGVRAGSPFPALPTVALSESPAAIRIVIPSKHDDAPCGL
ncbi:MAG TPA: hypothetical protein VKA04_03915, partial [Pseudodesulfovibrio sp.]|nr:hypothetical protein [Pseudodesulfovibrio sp.]